MQVALPIPTKHAYPVDIDPVYLTNEASEYYANNECDIVEEYIPMLRGQMERDITNLNRYHCNVKILRDATEEDSKEFSIPQHTA